MSNPNGIGSDALPTNPTPGIQRLLFVSDAAVADVDELPPVVCAIIDAALESGIYDREGNRLIPPRYFDAAGYRSTIRNLRTLRPEHLLTAHYPPLQGQDALEGRRVQRHLGGGHAEHELGRGPRTEPGDGP